MNAIAAYSLIKEESGGEGRREGVPPSWTQDAPGGSGPGSRPGRGGGASGEARGGMARLLT